LAARWKSCFEDGLVGAGADPVAVVVSPAHVKAERDAGNPRHVVEHVRALAEDPVDRDAGPLPGVPLGLIDQLAEVRRIDLDVPAAQPREFFGFLPHQPHAVREQLERVAVGVTRAPRRPDEKQHQRARQRHLNRAPGPSAGVRILLHRHHRRRRNLLVIDKRDR